MYNIYRDKNVTPTPDPPTVEIRNDPPTVENDPTEGIRGYSGNKE